MFSNYTLVPTTVNTSSVKKVVSAEEESLFEQGLRITFYMTVLCVAHFAWLITLSSLLLILVSSLDRALIGRT